MFGYVKTYQPQLKMGEFEQYRGVYCTLCKTLGKRFGLPARMTLSYDFTFLALFRMALKDDCGGFSQSRCSFNPTKKCLRCSDEETLAQTADAAMLLVYYKLIDDKTDGGFFRRFAAKTALLFARRWHKKAARRLPRLDELIAAQMRNQAALERDGCPSLDAAADPSALMLAALAADGAADEDERAVRERFGYCLGRWIYFMDALDDLPDDLRRGKYNPYAVRDGLCAADPKVIEDLRQNAQSSLNACAAACLESYDQLEIRRFDGILRNVLQYGMPFQQQRVLNGEKTS